MGSANQREWKRLAKDAINVSCQVPNELLRKRIKEIRRRNNFLKTDTPPVHFLFR